MKISVRAIDRTLQLRQHISHHRGPAKREKGRNVGDIFDYVHDRKRAREISFLINILYSIERPILLQRFYHAYQLVLIDEPLDVFVLAMPEIQRHLVRHVVLRLLRASLDVQEFSNDLGLLSALADQQEDAHQATYLVPEEGLTRDYQLAHVVAFGASNNLLYIDNDLSR